MSILQKIALTIMVVSFGLAFISFVAIKGSQADNDEKGIKTFTRLTAKCLLVFLVSTMVFVIGFIW